MFSNGGFCAVVKELIGFQISRWCIIDITTEEFGGTPDYQDSPSSGFPRDPQLVGCERVGVGWWRRGWGWGEVRMGCLSPEQTC